MLKTAVITEGLL